MNPTSPVPAVCEIDGCGVLAVGRCAMCKRAFCPSHQGYGVDAWMHAVPYIDMCAPCANASQAAAAKRAEEARAPFDYFVSGAARTDLLNSGVPSINLYYIYRHWEAKKGLFGGGGQYVDVTTPAGRGWVLGMFKWKYNKNGIGSSESDYVVEECLTALRDDTPRGSNYGLTYVRRCEGGFEDLSARLGGDFQQSWRTGEGWRDVMQAVKKLIEKPS